AAALDCGIPAAHIAGCLYPALPADPVFAFIRPAELSADSRLELRSQLSRLLSSDPAEWYAMQLRPHVSYQALTERVSASGITLSATYYPTEEIYRRTRKRLVACTRPVVAGLLFFQARAAQLTDLFAAVGDLAWGYRQTRSPRSPYARIPAAQIDCYRRTIGSFTPDMDILPAGATPLRPGDRVEIIGGEFMGHTATVARQLSRTIYRLKLLGSNAIEWVVDLPTPLITPAADSTAQPRINQNV
ncbi:MAG: hypothetical protein NC190_01315, partial [Bacteroides sp.]|nr:hypothetical protein [Bacteroides sp.]